MNSKTLYASSSQKPAHVNPFLVTAGLLRNDIRLLPSLLLLLSFCSIAETLVTPTLWLVFIDRILQLTVMSIVVMRWRNRFQTAVSPRIRITTVAMRIFGIGLFLWLTVTVAKTITIASQGPLNTTHSILPTVLGVTTLVLALVWCVRVYFYYVIAGFAGGTSRDIISRALRMHREAPGAATRALAAPLAITALATALFTAPYPDGRSLVLTTLASASQSIFWLLSTYTGMGFAFSLFGSADWRTAGMEAYSLERLQTLETQGRSKIAGILTPRSALKLTALAVVLLIVNTARLATEPPAVNIELTHVAAIDKAVHLEIVATDSEFRFQGFKPALLSLRSASGYPVSNDLIKASTSREKKEVLLELAPAEMTSTVLYLEFSTDRSKRDLEALEDLWLWYGFLPLKHIQKESFDK
jgi:hypothetical protein